MAPIAEDSTRAGSQERPTGDESWDEHYGDERDAAYLYRALAGVEADPERRALFQKLAGVEDRHVQRWEELFRESGRPLPAHTTALRTRALAWMARRFGVSLVLPMMLAEEGREVQAYLGLARKSGHRSMHKAAVDIAADSAVHARELSEIMGREGEPWHAGGSGGYLRSVVYGFNDGLTANFGLVAGVVGADVAPHIVVISGVAGAIADALSMGSSGFLAAKSEAEVQAHQIDMERHEMRLMPDLEEDELAVIYEAKGLTPERARETAQAMMKDPALALDAMVREELNIHPAELAPLKDGVVTGIATAIGAFIPIVPFFVLSFWSAVWMSLAVSMLAHFAIGAARSLFTGRSVWASGRDMFVVGFGVAAAGYFIGELLTRFL
ncbi:MAG TPA: VIT1/CCC1 transporter family protein [Vicinamibacterales bacterium]|jgi:predicted membrane protein (TIGR00267 family)|nr:VIT1/CCC1 transporter family protein [Vicinamibacterales bacterium]